MFSWATIQLFLQFFVNGLMVGAIYSLIALGVVVVFKSTKVFNFAVGDMIMVGGFITFTLISTGISPIAVIILSIISGILFGLIIERIALRPMIGQPGVAAIMVTLAGSFVLKGMTLLVWGAPPKVFPKFLPGHNFRAGGIVWSSELLWTFGGAMCLFALFFLFYKFTRFGLDMRATSESHIIAQARGVSATRIFALTWAIAGVTAMVGGVFLGVKLTLSLGMADVGLNAISAVIFGGLESIGGALIGGLIVGVLENLVGGFIDPSLKEISPSVILLMVLIFRPEGLFGLKRIERI